MAERWAAHSPRETAVESGQIQGRQERGWLSRIFGGAEDTKYFTDNHYMLKNVNDVRKRNFTLVLSEKTTVRVPVDTAGNLGGLYKALGNDDRYFRIESLDDRENESRTIHFQLDGAYADSFQDRINSVSVMLRKVYPAQPASTPSAEIKRDDIKNGQAMKDLKFNRLGMTGSDWLDYEYQVRWSCTESANGDRGAAEPGRVASQPRPGGDARAAVRQARPRNRRRLDGVQGPASRLRERGVPQHSRRSKRSRTAGRIAPQPPRRRLSPSTTTAATPTSSCRSSGTSLTARRTCS